MAASTIDQIYASDDPRLVHFPSRRSVVHSRNGMVSSTQPLANEAGYKILAAGGNAADAAVAMAAALNVTEPSSTGIGGDMFCLYYDAKTQEIKALNGSGRSPAALSLEKARELGVEGTEMGFDCIHAVTVPGACAGWFDTLSLFGSGKVSMTDVLAPAIDLARNGFPVSEISAYQWQNSEALIQRASPNGNEILSKTRPGCAPAAGEMMRNPTLADTFETIAKEGQDAFYKGKIAEAIVELVTSRGGVLTMEDLSSHASTPCDPISTHYAGLNVWEHPPNGQGIIALICLGLLREMQASGQIKSLSEMEHNSPEYLHILIETLRLAFADGRYYVTDPAFMKVTPEELLSSDYLRQRAPIFDPAKRSDIAHGSPANSSDTVYFSTADKDGNACSFIISNYAGFGTAAVPKGTGFTLQNRGCNFVLKEGHPNMLEGGKRPFHTIVPAMVTREDGSLWAVFACMGAWMQPQGQVQILANMLHFGHTPQAALDAPRICIGVAVENEDGEIESKVFLEEGIPASTVAALQKMGHTVEVVNGWHRGLFGRAQIIRRHVDADGTAVLSGGSDPRGDGAALPCP